jgi:hypothetical protein
MNTTITFLTGLSITIIFSVGVILYLRKHLKHILIELCGTKKRADFWLTFSTIFLTLTPFLFAMTYQPSDADRPQVFFELVNQLRCGLSGIIGSLVLMGFMVTVFIVLRPRTQERD